MMNRIKTTLRCKRWLIGAPLLLFVGLCLAFESGDSHSFQMVKSLDIFNSIVRELNLLYVDSIKPEKTVREGIDAMLYSLDPYTVYYPEEDRDELDMMIKNSYGGIGSIIRFEPEVNHTLIIEPYEGMPAATSGLKAGDMILEVDGKDMTGVKDASKVLRGRIGTQINVKVKRPGCEEPLDITVTRKAIEMPLIPYYGLLKGTRYGNLDGKVGYINLDSFTGNPSKEFKQAFLDLKKQGIEALVIDLRRNGGGLLDEAIEIANFFLPRGKTLVTTRGKSGQVLETYKTMREPLDAEIPIAILVSSSTASAAEILAGSMQDLDRAVIVGHRTFGKGLVQTTRPLPYGGAIKITTSKYYIPSGRCVQAIDYTNRNPDGSVGRIPDSLTHVFHTAKGRIVRDGGGVTPDTVIQPAKLANILYYLVNDNQIFDYATQYALSHPSIPAAEQFQLTDADYEAFKAQVKASDFKYDQQTEKILKNLKEMAEFEGYLQTSKAEFEALEKKLKHNLDHDLDYFAKDIRSVIAVEIVKRYYYQRGTIIQQLKDDDELKTAVDILANAEEYTKILE